MRYIFATLLSLLATVASAEPQKLNVEFGFFPKGTACKINGTAGRVTLKTGRSIKFKINGDTGNVSFRCQQPDGRSFFIATGPLLPQGNYRLVSVQINQDNHAHVFWDQGGLRKKIIPGILNWE